MPNMPNGTIAYRIGEAEKDIETTNKRVDGLESKIDRIFVTLFAAVCTTAGAMVLLALNLLVMHLG